MDTQTIERTDVDESVEDDTDSDRPKFFHYVKKDKIAESAVMGTHVVALCGEVFPVTKSAKPGSPARTVSEYSRPSRSSRPGAFGGSVSGGGGDLRLGYGHCGADFFGRLVTHPAP